jgi:large subunit ribosomal protein L30
MLRIKLVKSPIGHNTRNRATVQALGLRKVHHVVEHEDTPTIRGMIHHVKDLLVVEVAEGTPAKTNGTRPNRPAGTQRSAKPKRAAKPRAVVTVANAEAPAATVKKTAKTTPAKKTTAKDAPAKVASGAKPKAKPATAKAATPSKKKSEEK